MMCVLLLVFAAGCATVDDYPVQDVYSPPVGVTHKVQKGETLFRIAKAYDVKIEEIIRSNRIIDVSKIEVGDRILIPGVTKNKTVTFQADDPNKDEFAWPISGSILKRYGDRTGGHHSKGIKIKADGGDVVRASRQGKVVFADYLPGFAFTVIVDHQDGFHSVYSNNDRIETEIGEFVHKGEPLARIGKKGAQRFVYFEIRKDGRADNPLFYLPRL